MFGRTSAASGTISELIAGAEHWLTEDEQHKVAAAIVEHLERCNWKIESGAPRGNVITWVAARVILGAPAQKLAAGRSSLKLVLWP
jgi:hypothetical protein